MQCGAVLLVAVLLVAVLSCMMHNTAAPQHAIQYTHWQKKAKKIKIKMQQYSHAMQFFFLVLAVLVAGSLTALREIE